MGARGIFFDSRGIFWEFRGIFFDVKRYILGALRERPLSQIRALRYVLGNRRGIFFDTRGIFWEFEVYFGSFEVYFSTEKVYFGRALGAFTLRGPVGFWKVPKATSPETEPHVWHPSAGQHLAHICSQQPSKACAVLNGSRANRSNLKGI